jgi:uncharacterized protein YjbJ (UPF0337 family)
MNEDILQTQWKQLRGQVKQWWSVLSESDLDKINGRREKLIDKLQERYGFSREQAMREINDRLAQLPQPTQMAH